MDHHPFARVERYGVRVRDAGEPVPEFGAYERCARVRGVNVEPHVLRVAYNIKVRITHTVRVDTQS